MPGFAAPIFAPTSISSASPAGTTGFPDIGVIGKTAFYGFTQDVNSGRSTIDLFTNTSDLVSLPITGDVRDNEISEYREWIWTSARLKFSWGGDDTDHLYMEVI